MYKRQVPMCVGVTVSLALKHMRMWFTIAANHMRMWFTIAVNLCVSHLRGVTLQQSAYCPKW